MQTATRAAIVIEKPIDTVFDFATACETLPRVLHRFGPIPAIKGGVMIDASEPRTGAHRRMTMGDGSTLDEEIVAFERPRRHAYRWMNRPAPPFSYLVSGGQGDWRFTPEGAGTRIVWDYTFELTSPLWLPLMLPVRAMFRRWMQRGLERIRAELGG